MNLLRKIWEAVKIEGKGFRATRHPRKCHKCGKLGKEVFDPKAGKDESPWMCVYCGAHTPKRRKHKDQSQEAKKERKRKNTQKYRRTWPIAMRSGDRKVGTGRIGSHRHENPEKEKKEIEKEIREVGLRKEPRGPLYKEDILIEN